MEPAVPARRLLVWVLLVEVALVVVAIAIGHMGGDMEQQFAEGGMITWWSVLQLVIAAALSLRLRSIRSAQSAAGLLRSPRVLWGIAAVGLLFLAFDEAAQIHETLDSQIHDVLSIRETAATDRIDDIIVGCYVLIAAGILYRFREEWRTYVVRSPYLKAGLVLTLLMVGLDLVTNRDDLVFSAIADPTLALRVQRSLAVAEDALKVFAEGLFILAFVDWIRMACGKRNGSRAHPRLRGG